MSLLLEAGVLQRGGDGLDRANAHDVRRHAAAGVAHKARQRLEVVALDRFSLTTISAPAPSDVCELLPAVTLPRAENTVRSLARPSGVVSGGRLRRC
jgi:hypothetical protein